MKSILINNLELAQKELSVSGEISAAELPRLAESLTLSKEHIANIRYSLKGSHKKLSKPALHLHLQADLPVTCQRCLAPMKVQINLNFDYLLGDKEPTEEEESDDYDWLLIEQSMNLNDLIEDELLIAMPIAPVHEANCAPIKMESGEKPNPFAVLKGQFK